MPDVVERAFSRQPAWITTGTIPIPQAKRLVELMRSVNARVVIEAGTSSGFSAAMLAMALDEQPSPWELHTFDYGDRCYFDPSRRVGEAIGEVLGEEPRVVVHTHSTSLDIPARLGGALVDFAYIDASHSSPWAALDLLGMLGNLRPGAIVALDDIRLPLMPGWDTQNAGRDLFRTWRGQKWTYPDAPNLGVLRVTNQRQALADIAFNIQCDWDEPREDALLQRIASVLGAYDGVSYPGKEDCRLFLTRSAADVEHGNSHLQVSDFPFAKASILHPSDEGERDPVIVWPKLPLEGIGRLQIEANAFNEHADNPGARLLFEVLGKERTSIALDLPPHARASATLEVPRGTTSADVRVTVRRAESKPAAYAGVELQPLSAA